MDIAFPASNWLGIPDLDPLMAPVGVPLPVRGWGHGSRSTLNPGTWHFYADDYRFLALEKRPERILETGCTAAVEINLSVFNDTPLALAVATIYRKRYLACRWQRAGLRIYVDCNMPERVLDREESRFGIPNGWPAFATRGYDARTEDLDREYAWAKSFGADRMTFLVVGGGRDTAEWCQRTPGAFHSGYAAAKRAHSTANATNGASLQAETREEMVVR